MSFVKLILLLNVVKKYRRSQPERSYMKQRFLRRKSIPYDAVSDKVNSHNVATPHFATQGHNRVNSYLPRTISSNRCLPFKAFLLR